MERSATLPFSHGEITNKLTITGPTVERDDADRLIDTLFGRLTNVIVDAVIPQITGLLEQIEVEEHEQGQLIETLIEVEVLGNEIQVVIATLLDSVIDKDLIRSLVAAIVGSSFLATATRQIGTDSFYAIAHNPERVTYKETDDRFMRMSGVAVIVS